MEGQENTNEPIDSGTIDPQLSQETSRDDGNGSWNTPQEEEIAPTETEEQSDETGDLPEVEIQDSIEDDDQTEPDDDDNEDKEQKNTQQGSSRRVLSFEDYFNRN